MTKSDIPSAFVSVTAIAPAYNPGGRVGLSKVPAISVKVPCLTCTYNITTPLPPYVWPNMRTSCRLSLPTSIHATVELNNGGGLDAASYGEKNAGVTSLSVLLACTQICRMRSAVL